IESGARAAAAGGFTSVCCMPNTKPVNDSKTVTSYIVEQGKKAAVNVFPIGAITKGSGGEELAAIGAMKAAGAVAISDDGLPVMNSRVMRRAMEFARSYDLPIIQHCEDLNLSAGGDMHEGAQSVRWGLRGIPAASEDVMVARDLVLAQLTGARYHVAHISTRNAVAMVAYARSQGLGVEQLVHPGKITLMRLVELFTTGPETVMRLGRGTLAPGAPGDVTVFSRDLSWTYDVNQSLSRSRNSPFHGKTFRGGPVATVV